MLQPFPKRWSAVVAVYVLIGLAALVVILAFVMVTGALVVRRRVSRNPDPIPAPELRREPDGVETVLERPDGTRLRTMAAGSGPTVVLAHGYGVDLSTFTPMVHEFVRRGYRVIAFDQRGHGQTTIGSDGIGSAQMASDYQAVMEYYDVRDAVLLGHSMGGFVAIRAMLELSEVAGRLRGLVLMATWAGRILDGAPQNRVQVPMLKYGLLQKMMASPTFGVYFASTLAGKDPSPAMLQVFREVFGRPNHRALIPIVEAFAKEDRYPRLGEISVPTVVVCGTADKTTPSAHSKRLADGIPGARLVMVPDKGHLLNWEAPIDLVDAVDSLGERRPTV